VFLTAARAAAEEERASAENASTRGHEQGRRGDRAEGAGGDVPEAQPHQRTTVVSALLLPVPRLASPAISASSSGGTAWAVERGRREKACPLHLTKSIAAAQFRSNVHKRPQGWTVFHLPSTPGRYSDSRPPLRAEACRLAQRRRVLAASCRYLGSARTLGERLRRQRATVNLRRRSPSASPDDLRRGAVLCVAGGEQSGFDGEKNIDEQTCDLGEPIEKQFRVLEAVPLEEDGVPPAGRGARGSSCQCHCAN
jgi:hypothetical protein